MYYLIALTLALILSPTEAVAYIDPASGSMLLSLFIGVIGSIFYSIKSILYKIRNLWRLIWGVKFDIPKQKIIFYSEGSQYWNTFKPILNALDAREISALYLTSDKNDDGLNFKSKFISSKFIGSGNKAYTFLNTLECDVCVLTTPGLDTLQIRRSKGVQHYAYVAHSPLDMGKYKLFSFDAFDTIFISGEHQKKSIRELEALRGTHSKSLIKAGCPYMDELGEKLKSAVAGSNNLKNKTKRILLAPTWGENNLLRILKISTLKNLLNAGYHITIRPHPQSRVSELPLLDYFKKKLIKYESIEWDEEPDNFGSLLAADVVISDISGINFDFAFIFQKPVITIIFDYNFLGQEANDIPHQLWEMSMLKKIGATLAVSEIERLPYILQTTLNEQYKTRNLNKLRDENLYNYKRSGEVIAEHLRNLA